jgi:hypothetical protein
MKHMKRILLILAALLVCAVGFYMFFSRGPRDGGNYPPVPDTPVPDPHNGLFVSEYGSMEFNGDDTTVIIDFGPELAEMSGLPEGRQEGTYTFLSGNLPPHGSFDIRYDAAHELRITVGDNSVVIRIGTVTESGTVQVSLQTVTPEKIPTVFYKDDTPVGVVFELQK